MSWPPRSPRPAGWGRSRSTARERSSGSWRPRGSSPAVRSRSTSCCPSPGATGSRLRLRPMSSSPSGASRDAGPRASGSTSAARSRRLGPLTRPAPTRRSSRASRPAATCAASRLPWSCSNGCGASFRRTTRCSSPVGSRSATTFGEALDAGASAAVAGTRFLLSDESRAHPGYGQRLLDADETLLTELFGAGWPAPHRVVPNRGDRALAREAIRVGRRRTGLSTGSSRPGARFVPAVRPASPCPGPAPRQPPADPGRPHRRRARHAGRCRAPVCGPDGRAIGSPARSVARSRATAASLSLPRGRGGQVGRGLRDGRVASATPGPRRCPRARTCRWPRRGRRAGSRR